MLRILWINMQLKKATYVAYFTRPVCTKRMKLQRLEF